MTRQPGDSQGTSQLLLAQGVTLLKQDQPLAAAKVLAEAVAVSRAAGICNAYTIPCHAWLATAYRLAAVQHAYDLSDNSAQGRI